MGAINDRQDGGHVKESSRKMSPSMSCVPKLIFLVSVIINRVSDVYTRILMSLCQAEC